MGLFDRMWNLGRGFARVLSRGEDDRREEERAAAALDRETGAGARFERRAPVAADAGEPSGRADRLERLNRSFAEGRISRDDYEARKSDIDGAVDEATFSDGEREVKRTL